MFLQVFFIITNIAYIYQTIQSKLLYMLVYNITREENKIWIDIIESSVYTVKDEEVLCNLLWSTPYNVP